jgi:hypothetical protein
VFGAGGYVDVLAEFVEEMEEAVDGEFRPWTESEILAFNLLQASGWAL